MIATIIAYFVLSVCGLMVISSAITRNKHLSSYVIWHFISWLQSFQWIVLIATDIPDLYLEFFKDYLDTINVVQINSHYNPCSIPSRFRMIGFDYPYFINNAEKVLIFFTIALIISLTLSTGIFKSLKYIRCGNIIIRCALLCYFNFFLYGLLQIIEFEITTWYGIMNSVISVAIIASLIVLLVFLFIYVISRDNMNSSGESEKLSTCFEEFKLGSDKYQLFYIFFMLERVLTAISYTLLSDYYYIQCTLIEFILVIKCKKNLVIYVLILRPFNNQADNFYVAFLDLLLITSVLLSTSFSFTSSYNTKVKLAHATFSLFVIGASISVGYYILKIACGVGTRIEALSTANTTEIQANDSNVNDSNVYNFNRKRNGSIETDDKNIIQTQTHLKNELLKNENQKKVFFNFHDKDVKAKQLGHDEKKLAQPRSNLFDPNRLNDEDSISRKEDEPPMPFNDKYGQGIPYYGPLSKKYHPNRFNK